MTTTRSRHGVPEQSVTIGGKRAAVMFVLMLLAFVVQSQLTQYVESDLNFRQPYLLFYIAHSTMSIIFPLHLFFLHISTPFSVQSYLRGLSLAIKGHLSSRALLPPSEISQPSTFPTAKLLLIIALCTVGMTIPGVLWFAAITLSSVSDVTAIWNSNAFWAYAISVKLHHSSWEPRRLASVVIASFGVLAVVYGNKDAAEVSSADHPKAPFLGNILTLVGSVGYGLYQVSYNMYAVPPSEAQPEHDDWRRLSFSSNSVDEVIATDEDSDGLTLVEDIVYPPPFGLYANALTSSIGVMTLFTLWIPLPILHVMSTERFEWPRNLTTLFSVGGIALSGVTFYAAFMILLGVWGPIITSVGNLLTIVLVMVSDIIFGNAIDTLTIWSVVGSGMVVCAFAVLCCLDFLPNFINFS